MKPRAHILKSLALLLLFCLVNCHSEPTIPDAENKFLTVFQTERHDLERFENGSYVAYMEYQIANFDKKQKRAAALIKQINRNFDAMNPGQQIEYQKKWSAEFQPVVDQIYERTRALIVKQTAELTPEDMTRIQELTIQMQEQTKNAPDAKLKPMFFKTPHIDAPNPPAP
jgi:hypothetical protein